MYIKNMRDSSKFLFNTNLSTQTGYKQKAK